MSAEPTSSENPGLPAGARLVYFVSDHTGLTTEVLGQSLLARFEDQTFVTHTRPFVDSRERAEALAEELRGLASEPVVFSTITDAEVREPIAAAAKIHIDLFAPFLGQLEALFGRSATRRIGTAHGIRDIVRYQARIDAIEFALNTDDGANIRRYGQAEVVMVGVSRVGKSPTCLYLAMQYGVRASNYPLADDDFERESLPAPIIGHRNRLFGLTIQPTRLRELRQRRRPDSVYASLERCEYEVRRGESLFRNHGIPFTDVSNLSVEELAASVLQRAALGRHR